MFNIPVAPEIKVIPKKVDSTQIFVAQMKQLLPLTLYFHNDEPDKKTLAITTTKNYKKTYEDYYAMRELYISEYSKGAKDAKLLRAINDIDILFEDSIDAVARQTDHSPSGNDWCGTNRDSSASHGDADGSSARKGGSADKGSSGGSSACLGDLSFGIFCAHW